MAISKISAKKLAEWKKVVREAVKVYEADREYREGLVADYEEWRQRTLRHAEVWSKKVDEAREKVMDFVSALGDEEPIDGSLWDEARALAEDALHTEDAEEIAENLPPSTSDDGDSIAGWILRGDEFYEDFVEAAENCPREWGEEDEDEEDEDDEDDA